MAKKKLFKDDGTEDFEKEALEPDETSPDAGNVSELIDQAGDKGKEQDVSPATPAAESDDKSASTDGGLSDKPADATGDETASVPAAELPDLTEAHPEAQPAVELDPEIAEILKDAGNKVGPVLQKLRDLEEKAQEIEEEAKNRFLHMRTKAIEFVATLESWFKRG